MVTDCQVRKLMKLLNEEQTLSLASAKSGMDEKTARKYRCLGKVPSEVSKEHSWRTREDPFAEMPAQDDCKAHGPWPGRKHRH